MSQSPQELLKSGDLAGALGALQAQVRADASDPKLRIFLFQLLCVLGDWNRAITQLKLSAELEPLAIPMAQTYREAIICEVYRGKVFAGEKDPLIFGEPLEWVALMIEANRALAQGNAAHAADLRARAFDQVPDQGGAINGDRFDWIADADMRLGPLLEIIVNGRYFWMPFSAIDTLTADPPEDLRDAVWTAANLKLRNGGECVALIPTRYVGTDTSLDHAAMLSRTTTWADAGADTHVGTGQRLLTTGDADVAIMDLRSLQMDPVAADG
ncbi:type VI secretion system accessory protein TagJ [Sulfitobacter sabulilitoris]|uniref:Virulence protein SciE type n=1 Tax=Sulfitobacter sabulilitoris TaxID=2562655 RepID=A0A5S3PIE4_9RHOB|nr:type VI secretion system accessory protein TagJ [Sulfitobacter sabulilitoris]TMM54129.1 virulence protein SciE type [Sulfitobacter sabulilitoris]